MRLAFMTLLVLAGCGGGGESADAPAAGVPAQPGRAVAQPDAEIAALVYSDRQRTPPGFVDDAPPSGYWQVATTHLAGCTDDWDEALAWSETAAQDAAVYSDLVATQTDPRYHEFGRVTRATPATYLRMRVYRCAYFDPVAGELNVRPLDAALVASFAEYQWLFTTYNNFGNVVLERATRATEAAIGHTLDIAVLERAADPGDCDRIDVIAWSWSVDPASGAVTVDTAPLFSLRARLVAGVSEVCAG